MKKLGAFVLTIICLVGLVGCNQKKTDYLVLVNKQNKISDDYINGIELVDIVRTDGEVMKLEKKTCEAYWKLHDELLKDGIEIGVDSSYRSIERQKKVMAEFIEEYGEEYARKTVADPGTSEHHTALAVDIVPKINGEWVLENEDMMKETEIFAKIHARLSKFGFILRYPKGKEDITGQDYEPWHLRYVGEKVAKEIYDNQITLEEYLEKNK